MEYGKTMAWDADGPPAREADLRQMLDTLGYWMDVEALTPPDAEEDGEEGARKSYRVVHYPDHEFPWADGQAKPNTTYRHFIRFGIFSKEAYTAELVRRLSVEAEEDFDTRPAARTFGFLGVFAADDRGVPVQDTLQIAAFAVAFEAVRPDRHGEPGADWDDYRRSMEARFADLAAPLIADGRPVGADFLKALRDAAAETLTWLADMRAGAPLAVIRASVASVVEEQPSKAKIGPDGLRRVRRRERHFNPTVPPVDSFYFDELRMLRNAVENWNAGLLMPYILGTPNRTDCTDLRFLADACRAPSHPPGRWPADHGLFLMQQAAVDLAWSRLAKGGLFSVNGPPGTGKTTLLKDLVAAVLVRRAELLCDFGDPADAFVAAGYIGDEASPGPVYELAPELLDHLIVVASSNNGAVEQVTRQLPNAETVSARFLDGVDFFRAAADALLEAPPPDEARDDEEEEEEEERTSVEQEVQACDEPPRAWGLISAVLGKKKNRIHFTSTLRRRHVKGPERGCEAQENIFRGLAEARRSSDWQGARDTFLQDIAKVRVMQMEIDGLDAVRGSHAAADGRVSVLEGMVGAAERDLAAAESDLKSACQRYKAAKDAYDRADKGADMLRHARPTRLRVLAFLRWQDAMVRAAEQREVADRALGLASEQHAAARAARDAANQRCGEFREKLTKASLETAELAAYEEKVVARHPALLTVEEALAERNDDLRQHHLPGNSRTLADARARLFASALRVHLAFLCEAGDRFERNLDLALAMLEGQGWVYGTVRARSEHLWSTLALITPAVSTTFAALPRIFKWVGVGGIPWLLIDEAGQAVPHHAAPAIWRAKRAVVVGDPFQVEPVITFDRNADTRLAEQRGVPERLRATVSSAQRLADDANEFGVSMPETRGGAASWIGCPLVVHRRCANPMFGISNRLAYHGRMVLGRGKEEDEAELTSTRPLIGKSVWIDVAASAGGPKHFIREQGDLAIRLVAAFLERHIVDPLGLPKIFVISPFRSVADCTRTLLVDHLKMAGLPEKDAVAWGEASVGTVHKFQGREREAVVLVLGGASDGAIAWAAGTPNILNVAVTRAQRRLYVIGDRHRWMRNELVAELDVLRAIPAYDAIGRLKARPRS